MTLQDLVTALFIHFGFKVVYIFKATKLLS